MTENNTEAVDIKKIKKMLNKHKVKMKLSLKVCAHCTLCAESCVMYMSNGKEPEYMPSHKFINSIGKLYKNSGNVDMKTLEEIRDTVWNRCVLCMRCYCPLGIDIPEMIVLARSICRSQGVFPTYD